MKIKELREICQTSIKGKDIWSWYEVQRRVSIYFTKLFVTIGFSANQVTFLNLLIVMSALSLIHFGWFVFGFCLLQLYFVLDCSDGEVARFFGQSGPKGLFLDRLVHIVTEPLLFLVLANSIGHLWLGIIPAFCCENGLRLITWTYKISYAEEGKKETSERKIQLPFFTNLLRFFAIYGFSWLILIYLLGEVWLFYLLMVWNIWTLLACIYLVMKFMNKREAQTHE